MLPEYMLAHSDIAVSCSGVNSLLSPSFLPSRPFLSLLVENDDTVSSSTFYSDHS